VPGNTATLSGRIAELDGFRAFAVILVMFTHTWPMDNSLVWHGLQLSWIRLDGLFVISGFLIAGILLDTRAEPGFFQRFYRRRALRILPLYYALLVSLTLLGVFSQTPGYREMLTKWGSPLWFFAYVGNIPTALTGDFPFGLGESFVPLWSLQIEEQFYLVFPVLVYFFSPKALKIVLWVLAALSVIIRMAIFALYPENRFAQYVLLPCRMEGLSFGALIAIRLREGPWEIRKTRLSWLAVSWLIVAVLCAAITGSRCETPFNRTLGYLVSSIAAARLILWLIFNQNSKATSFLRWKPVQHLGRISYGVYLLHEPVQWAITSADRHLGLKWFDHGLLIVPAVIVVTLFAAAASWRYLEAPLLRLKDRTAPRSGEAQLLAA
jgi:peptidoglycan/LPS O-acetylase OafA/YrhL